MIGIIRDPVFGPVISFGSGGTTVEIMGDSAISLPPLNRRLALDLINRTKVSRLLGEFRNMPAVDMDQLIDVLLGVSSMACELPWIREMDINPLIIDENGVVAVDARIVVEYPKPSTDPYHHLAIHPYPSHLVKADPAERRHRYRHQAHSAGRRRDRSEVRARTVQRDEVFSLHEFAAGAETSRCWSVLRKSTITTRWP